MSHRIPLSAVVALVAVSLVACDRAVDVTSPTRAARAASFTKDGTVKTNQKIDIVDQTIENTCNGDVVTVNGTEHVAQTTNADGSMSIHVNFDDLKGVGVPSGAQYHLNAGAHAHEFIVGAGSETDEVVNEELIGQGDTNNNITIHITESFNPDGSTTVKRMTMDCH